jgi:hypothetical protein
VQQSLTTVSGTQQQQQQHHSTLDELSDSYSVVGTTNGSSSDCAANGSGVQRTLPPVLHNGLNISTAVHFRDDEAGSAFVQHRWVIN